MNGRLPILNDNAVTNNTLNDMIADAFEKFTASNEPSKNLEECLLDGGKSTFWLGQTKVNKTWVDPYNSLTNFANFQVIPSGEKCSYIWSDKIYQIDCMTAFPCGICYLPNSQLLRIKGIIYNTKYAARFTKSMSNFMHSNIPAYVHTYTWA